MQNDREKILAGLAEMLGGSFRFEKELFEILQDASPLEGHPFGLDMTMRLSGIAWPNAERICLVSCPGWTDGSVKALAAVALDAAAYSVGSIRYVRIIESYHEMGKHNLFFEIGTHNGTFIAGGCQTFNSNDAALDSFGCPGILASRRSEPTTTPPKQSIEASDRNPFNYQPPPSAEQLAAIRAKEAEAVYLRGPKPDGKVISKTTCKALWQGRLWCTNPPSWGRECETCEESTWCDYHNNGKMDNCSPRKDNCRTECRPFSLFQ
ncbi:hypothetical protein FJY94_04270 [Candidatus Kaiserbacteria bacterium]|nr:hypothetical protein [Candidatus Kaiserbacteria bacterium]